MKMRHMLAAVCGMMISASAAMAGETAVSSAFGQQYVTVHCTATDSQGYTYYGYYSGYANQPVTYASLRANGFRDAAWSDAERNCRSQSYYPGSCRLVVGSCDYY